jgi:uncharacterized membrane protein HdeD (DUF308 family)
MPSIDAATVTRPISRHWLSLFLFGVAMMLFGVWAIAHPLAATMATVLWLGAVLATAGIARIAQVWLADGWAGTVWHLGSGALCLIGGFLVVFRPLAGMVTLVVLVAGTLIASGGIRAAGGFALKPHDGWLWMTAGGVISILAGVAMLLIPPAESMLVPGLLVGVSLLAEGAVALMLALAARRAAAA